MKRALVAVLLVAAVAYPVSADDVSDLCAALIAEVGPQTSPDALATDMGQAQAERQCSEADAWGTIGPACVVTTGANGSGGGHEVPCTSTHPSRRHVNGRVSFRGAHGEPAELPRRALAHGVGRVRERSERVRAGLPSLSGKGSMRSIEGI